MDIHKPKPWHGWREFLKEYAIIVVGVLTALAAEQGVEWLHWRHEVAEAHANLKPELQQNARSLRYSSLENACLLSRLSEYAAWSKGGPKPAFIRLATFGPVGDSVWQVVKAGQVAAHLPLEERVAYSRLYDANANTMFVLAEVRKAAGQLYRYEDDTRLSPAATERLSGDVAEMRALLAIHQGNIANLLRQTTALSGQPGPMADWAKARLAKTCGDAKPSAG